MSDKNTLLNPDQWDLLHQEGLMLLEQINRKLIQPFVSQTLICDATALHNDDLQQYTQRSIQRIEAFMRELMLSHESFSRQVNSSRKALARGKGLPVAPQTTLFSQLSSRGPLNLELSPSDYLLTCEALLMLFYNELQSKLDIMGMFLNILNVILEYIMKALSELPSHSSTQSDLTDHAKIDPVTTLVERYPWLNTFVINTTSLQLTHNQPNIPEKSITFDSSQYILTCLDYNGIIHLYDSRPGYDHTQYTRFTESIKHSSFQDIQGVSID